jgi:hypothetical protein
MQYLASYSVGLSLVVLIHRCFYSILDSPLFIIVDLLTLGDMEN